MLIWCILELAEWELKAMWKRVELALPQDWDMVYLGYCNGKERASK